MTVPELQQTLNAKKVGPAKKSSPPQPKPQKAASAPVSKTPPKKTPAPVERVTPKADTPEEAALAINKLNKYDQMDIEVLKSLAKMGDANAVAEVAVKHAGATKAAKVRVRPNRADAPGLESGWKESIRRMAERFKDETGAAGPGVGRVKSEIAAKRASGELGQGGVAGLGDKAFDLANQGRMFSMLSGLAPAKSLLGNIGAHGIGAMENPTLAKGIMRELTNVGEHGRMFKEGWKTGVNPALDTTFSKWNIPGRAMGAANYAAQKSLQRAGMSEEAAREILLTTPNPLSTDPMLSSKLGKLLVPFRTVPYNAFRQGLSQYKKHPGIYAGATAAGFGAGGMTEDPEKIALMSAALGPYSLPFLVGAGMRGGGRALHGISPIPEWSLVKSITDPLSPFTDSPGKRWIPGQGEETESEKARGRRVKARSESREKRVKERESKRRR